MQLLLAWNLGATGFACVPSACLSTYGPDRLNLQKIENLDALVNLEELWLGKNKIAKLEVLSPPSTKQPNI